MNTSTKHNQLQTVGSNKHMFKNIRDVVSMAREKWVLTNSEYEINYAQLNMLQINEKHSY